MFPAIAPRIGAHRMPSSSSARAHASPPFLNGGGELGERIRAFDWSSTPLGDPWHWPHGLRTAFISNGNATAEVLDYIRPWTDAYKIDLKAMDDRRYRELGGVLQHVLDAIRLVHERGFWLEVVTLVVPGFNDDDAQLARAADHIAAISPDIPWHVTAFHKDYRMTDPDDTRAEALVRACEIGARAGLRFVYAGNLPGRVGRWENTYCPGCGDLLIERTGYVIRRQRVGPDGSCPECRAPIPGIWC